MNGNPDVDLQFSPDFALRVLDAADRLVTRRRRRRVVGVSALCAGVAAVFVWVGFSTVPQGPAQDRSLVFAALVSPKVDKEPGTGAAEPATAPDALSWFFPDAGPLARYAAADAPDDSGGSAGALFGDDD